MPECLGCGVGINGGLLEILLDPAAPCGLGCDSTGLYYKNIVGGAVDNRQTTTSTTYTDLATFGPSVSPNTGTRALVLYDSIVQGNGTAVGRMSIEVTGSTNIAAEDNVSLGWGGDSDLSLSGAFLFTTLNPGVNNFICKYKSSDGGQVIFEFRKIHVIY